MFFKKASGKARNLRKRPSGEEGEEGRESTVIQKKAPRKTDSQLGFSSQTSKRQAEEKESRSSTDNEKGCLTYYESAREMQTHTDSLATATLETETEFDKDARTIRERVLKQADDALRGKKTVDEKVYKGIHGYTDHKAGFRREHTVSGEKAGGAHGPLRASAHIRCSTRFDYQPDICKDYKETGYCGYGDSCKFMHDRGDYKSGWQMDREWDEAEKKRKERLARGLLDNEDDGPQEEEEDDGSLPFACFICRQAFKDPVVTICKHYFCEQCALKHYAKNKHCFVCNKPTNGVFNTAFEILKRASTEAGDGSKT